MSVSSETPETLVCQPPLSLGFSRQEWSGLPFPSPGDLPDPGIEPRSPTLQADSLPSVPLGKSKNTGEGSLPLLQGNLPVQESNQGLLHCRRILHQLNHQGSPMDTINQKLVAVKVVVSLLNDERKWWHCNSTISCVKFLDTMDVTIGGLFQYSFSALSHCTFRHP